jgi:hypothetical protein
MIGFNYYPEGAVLRQGINYRWDSSCHPIIAIKLWIFVFYFRIRPKALAKACHNKRFIFGFAWKGCTAGWGFPDYDFDTRMIRIAGHNISWEVLVDILNQHEVI